MSIWWESSWLTASNSSKILKHAAFDIQCFPFAFFSQDCSSILGCHSQEDSEKVALLFRHPSHIHQNACHPLWPPTRHNPTVLAPPGARITG